MKKMIVLRLLSAFLLLGVMPARAEVTIWVKSSSAPYVYAWNGDIQPLDKFPGKQLTVQDEVTGWWLCYLPDLDEANLIFSNGSGGYGNQTGNIEGVTGTRYYQYPGDGDNGTYTDLGSDVADIATPPAGVVFNKQNFPDENFRKYLTDNKTGFTELGALVKTTDLNNIGTLSVARQNIASLKGIEHFSKLKDLQCNGNLSLGALDLSNNRELTRLICTSCGLAQLDLTNNTKLTELQCAFNSIGSLVVSDMPHLVTLICGNNGLEALDVSKNKELLTLKCNNNRLKELALTNNAELTTLTCSSNQLMSLILTANTKLQEVDCNSNPQLTELDVRACEALNRLNCFNCNLPTLDVTKNTNLSGLGAANNNLTELDVSNNTKLNSFQCNLNHLTALDLSGLTLLKGIPGQMNYSQQTRTLTAESFEKKYGNETEPRRYYYFRLDDNKQGDDEENILERMAETSNTEATSFLPGLVTSWKSGCRRIAGTLSHRITVADDEVTADDVYGDILLLTNYTVSGNEARGTITYTYDVNFEGTGTDPQSVFTIYWVASATKGVVTSVVDIADDALCNEVVAVTYYNLSGMASAQPWSGVNMVEKRYADGTTQVTKLMR